MIISVNGCELKETNGLWEYDKPFANAHVR